LRATQAKFLDAWEARIDLVLRGEAIRGICVDHAAQALSRPHPCLVSRWGRHRPNRPARSWAISCMLRSYRTPAGAGATLKRCAVAGAPPPGSTNSLWVTTCSQSRRPRMTSAQPPRITVMKRKRNRRGAATTARVGLLARYEREALQLELAPSARFVTTTVACEPAPLPGAARVPDPYPIHSPDEPPCPGCGASMPSRRASRSSRFRSQSCAWLKPS